MVHSFTHSFNEDVLSTKHRTESTEEDRALSLTEHGSNAYTGHGTWDTHRLAYPAVIKNDMLQEY